MLGADSLEAGQEAGAEATASQGEGPQSGDVRAWARLKEPEALQLQEEMKNLLTQRTQICRCKMHWIPKKLPPWAIPSLGLLLPQPGMEPMPLAVEAWSLNHWITREVPGIKILFLRKAQPTPAQPSPSSLCTYLPLGQKPHGLISQRSRPGHGTLGQPGHL